MTYSAHLFRTFSAPFPHLFRTFSAPIPQLFHTKKHKAMNRHLLTIALCFFVGGIGHSIGSGKVIDYYVYYPIYLPSE